MAAVIDYVGMLERLSGRDLRVDSRLCVVARNRNAPCRRCAAACTSGCISLDGNDLSISPEHCIGCGTCASVCPTGALVPRNPSDDDLLAATMRCIERTGDVVVFACANMMERVGDRVDPDTVVSVTCAGRIEESVVLFAAAHGARRVAVVTDECLLCEHATGGVCATDVAETANTLLSTWGSLCRVAVVHAFPGLCRATREPAYDAQRREFFAAMRGEAKEVGREVVAYSLDKAFEAEVDKPLFPHVTEDGTLPHYIPPRRWRLLGALRALGEPDDEMIGTRLWGHVVIDAGKCRGCKMCAVFCPTGALAKYDDGSTSGLMHAPGMCVKCRLCEALCPEGAISISDEVFAVDLHAGYVECTEMPEIGPEKGGPDAIRMSMSRLIDSPYVWG